MIPRNAKGIAMLLYKYRPPEFRSMLVNRKVVYSPVRAFNDPFECSPAILTDADREAYNVRMVGVLDQLARIQYKLAGPSQFGSLETFVAGFISDNYNGNDMTLDASMPMRDDVLRIVACDNGADFGVLSLSAVRDNPLMWSHYAHGHHGFVVGFDDQDGYFHLPGVLGGRPLEVGYSTHRLSWTWATMRPENWYLTKSVDWLYEHEWRVLRRLSEAAGPVNPLDQFDSFGPGPSYFDFPASAVKEIIFGARMIEEERAEFMEDVRESELYGHVEFLQASTDSREFRMKIQKL